jgi:hypothetical protein
VYPNPAGGGEVFVRYQLNNYLPVKIQLCSMDGRILYSGFGTLQSGTYTIDVSEYSGGLYIIQIINNNQIATRTIFILK